MSTTLNHYILFPALTLFALSGLQLPIMAAMVQPPISEQESTVAPFHAQGKIRLAQAGSNCRMIKNGGGALYTSSSGTNSVPLNRGTLVEVNLKNVSNGRVQVEVPSQNYTSGFVKASDLTSCKTPSDKVSECYKVRNLAEIKNMGGLPIRQIPSLKNNQPAYSPLEIGKPFRATSPLEVTFKEGLRWIKIAPTDDRVGGYVSDGPIGNPVRNLEPTSCTGVK